MLENLEKGDSTESFSTIVNPTQPDGHENFHSLF